MVYPVLWIDEDSNDTVLNLKTKHVLWYYPISGKVKVKRTKGGFQITVDDLRIVVDNDLVHITEDGGSKDRVKHEVFIKMTKTERDQISKDLLQF